MAVLAVLGLAVLASRPEAVALVERLLRPFAVLAAPAGFQIGEFVLPAAPTDSLAWLLVSGFLNTLRVSALALAAAPPLGLALALLRRAGHPGLRLIAGLVIEPLRNTPVVLQLILWYGLLVTGLPGPRDAVTLLPGIHLSNRGLVLPWFGAGGIEWPVLRGFNFEGGLALSPELTALAIGLAVFHAAYLAEIFRGALAALPDGQRDAARALGLSRLQGLRLVSLPLALSAALPPLAMQVLALVKNSSLAVAVGYPDLASIANTAIGQSGHALAPTLVLVAFYFGLNAAIGAVIERYNARLAARGPAGLVIEASRRPETGFLPGWTRGRMTRLISIVACGAVVALLFVGLRWAVTDAAWHGGAAACRMAAGACWPLIAEKGRLILFGTYPAAELWRPALAGLLLAGLAVSSLGGLFRSAAQLGAAWLGATLVWLWLMGGGLGLPRVTVASWGGLAVTLGLAAGTLIVALPLAIPLALARMSGVAAIRRPASLAIDLLRSVPLVSLLFTVAILLPALLPGLGGGDPLWRALTGLVLLTAANFAEVLRGALQALPRGLVDGALALGLTRRQAFLLVELPQAGRIALPAMVNVAIGAFKDTSLVFVVGVVELMGATRVAALDPEWSAHAATAYVAAALLYGLFCGHLVAYGRRLERGATAASAETRRATSLSSLNR
ncbi:MAG: ABC transporter permease subunit [Rhizobiales bacterium]|nr:ABC transporter permease subunit [Hyphomicrobiales bacterium]